MGYLPGEFFYHRDYGVGQVVRTIDSDPPEYEIRFDDGTTSLYTEFLLQHGFQKLSRGGFRALAYTTPDEAIRLVKENPVDVICQTLEDFPAYKAKTDDLRGYLEPYLAKDWTRWWKKTQLLLKDDVRIDTTNSRLQEYALARQVRSRAEEAYLSFHYAKRSVTQPGELVERAIAALVLLRKGYELPQEHRDDLLDYLHQIINSDRYSINLRLDTLFHMSEGGWIDSANAHKKLERLLQREFRLYQVEPYTRNRLVDILINEPLTEGKKELLASGICTDEKTIKKLLNWAVQKSQPGFMLDLIACALSENFPTEKTQPDYQALRTRLEASRVLAKGLPSNYPGWPSIIGLFPKFVESIISGIEGEGIDFLLPSLLKLTHLFWRRVLGQNQGSEELVLLSLINPNLPSVFLLALLDALDKVNVGDDFKQQLQDRLWTAVDSHADHFLKPFLNNFWDDPLEQVEQLVQLAQKYPQSAMIERTGAGLVEICRQIEDVLLIQMIPYMEYFRGLPGEWRWCSSLNGLREKAYYEMLLGGSRALSGVYFDEAIVSAAHKWSSEEIETINQRIMTLQDQLEAAQQNISNLQALLDERNKVVKELRSGLSGRKEETSFEERSRFLKELVSSIAEIERFVAAQPSPSKEADAFLKRFSSLLTSYRVVSLEPISSQVVFNPQLHRLTETGSITPGEAVTVVERGYLIRDHEDKLRLLKPAIVKK